MEINRPSSNKSSPIPANQCDPQPMKECSVTTGRSFTMIGCNTPAACERNTPTASKRILHAAIERIIPAASERIVPADSERSLPATGECNLPTASKRILPAASERSLPATRKCNLPPTSKRILPATGECSLLAASERIVPADSKRSLPATRECNLPAASKRILPAASERTLPAVSKVNPTAANERGPLVTSERGYSVAAGQGANIGSRSPRRRKHFFAKKHRQPQAECNVDLKVHVTGFPPFTQVEDLERKFSKNGIDVHVDFMNRRIAILTFPTKEDAKAALQQSDKVIIYGSFLKIKPFNPKEGHDAEKNYNWNHNKTEFPRSKQKESIIDPKQIDMSGEFYEQMDRILASVRLTQEEVVKLGALYADLEFALQEEWPGCAALPFGSITTGLGMKNSDADCFVDLPAQYKTQSNPDALIIKTRRLLQEWPDTFAEIFCIPRANTPIVKFFHIPTETNCDVSFKTLLGVRNSKLISFLLHLDCRILPLCVVIRYWAKVHELSGTGRLTNYALTLLIIFYLQQPPVALLPSISSLQTDSANDFIVDNWNTGFISDHNYIPKTKNHMSLAELLGGFFEFYALFNFEEMVVCPYLGSPIKKNTFTVLDHLPVEFERYKHNVTEQATKPLKVMTAICVQDPLEQCHNVASGISSRLAATIKAFFKFAANAYEKDKVNHCNEFLKIILLLKPKITNIKSNPEYRVHLFPKMVTNLSNVEWKNEIKDVLFTIFEKILQIKLGKMEEKMTPNARKEKEKYVGAATRAVWKRKQFSKLYTAVKLEFLEKETRITNEIIHSDKQQISLQFNLTVTYCYEPKSAVITIKMVNGNLDLFREFGKFFHLVLPDWFMKLMRNRFRGENIELSIRNKSENEEEKDSIDDNSDG